MKNEKASGLISKLSELRTQLAYFTGEAGRADFVKGLDDLIVTLTRLRVGLTESSATAERASKASTALDEVIGFLDAAKNDEALRLLLSSIEKPKAPPVVIPQNLSNEQIRDFLKKDLSRADLKAIASQRSISVGKSNTDEIRRDILKNLDRQEGYGRLAGS
jgi:CRISPR/Cas system CSM-associated protein Csm2 small subunit